jgi:hypothetical protein
MLLGDATCDYPRFYIYITMVIHIWIVFNLSSLSFFLFGEKGLLFIFLSVEGSTVAGGAEGSNGCGAPWCGRIGWRRWD